MKAYDFEVVVYDGSVYCVECLPEGIDVASDDVLPIFADSEWDTAPVCEHCGAVHDYMTILDVGNGQSEPEDGDLTTTDHETFYQDGKIILSRGPADRWDIRHPNRVFLGTFADCEDALRAYMDRVQFWPNCWFISDHGNAHLMDLTRKDGE